MREEERYWEEMFQEEWDDYLWCLGVRGRVWWEGGDGDGDGDGDDDKGKGEGEGGDGVVDGDERVEGEEEEEEKVGMQDVQDVQGVQGERDSVAWWTMVEPGSSVDDGSHGDSESGEVGGWEVVSVADSEEWSVVGGEVEGDAW